MALEVPRHGQTSNLLGVVAAPLLVMLIPIFDTMFVTMVRLLSGRRASQGGRDHTSHRLVAIGLPEKTAVRVSLGPRSDRRVRGMGADTLGKRLGDSRHRAGRRRDDVVRRPAWKRSCV